MTGALRVYWVNQYAVTPDQPGGTRHFDMAAELLRRGIDCVVVASDLNLSSRSYTRRHRWWDLRMHREVVDGVPFHWLSAGTYRRNDWRRAMSMVTFAAVVFLHLLRVPRDRGDVFIGSSPHLFGAAATWLAARVRRVAFVFEVRDLWPESYTGVSGKDDGIEVRVLRLLADLLYRRADAVVVLASPNVRNVLRHGADPARVHVIPNGVDVRSIGAHTEPVVDLGRTGRFTFVYAGAHGPANGLETVLDACASLASEGDDRVRVVLLGDGPVKSALQAGAHERGLGNIDFWEPVTKSEIHAVLSTADCGLMVLAPVELFATGVSPNKLFDYLACDLPVLANVPGLVAQIVDEAGCGLNVAPGDPRALADGMRAMATLPERQLERMKRGRTFVEANYERRALAARLEEVLRSVSGRP